MLMVKAYSVKLIFRGHHTYLRVSSGLGVTSLTEDVHRPL